jgi:hypothetical protein
MRKREEVIDPQSCFNRALGNEMLFVLLGRDPDAPATIDFWANRRQRRLGMATDMRQIDEAFRCSKLMDVERNDVRYTVASGQCETRPVEACSNAGIAQAPQTPAKAMISDLLHMERALFEFGFGLMSDAGHTGEVEAAFTAMKDVHCAIDALHLAVLARDARDVAEAFHVKR